MAFGDSKQFPAEHFTDLNLDLDLTLTFVKLMFVRV